MGGDMGRGGLVGHGKNVGFIWNYVGSHQSNLEKRLN